MSYVERNAFLNRIAALEAERDQLREALRDLVESVEIMGEESVITLDDARRLLGDCPIHGVAHSSAECAAAEDAPSLDA